MSFRALPVLFMLVFGFGNAFANPFLSYDKFQELNHKQKEAYVQALRDFVVALDQSPYLSSDILQSPIREIASQSQNFDFDGPTRQEIINCTISPEKARRYSKEEFISKLQSMNQCHLASKNGSPKYRIPESAASIEVLAEELQRRIDERQLSRRERGVTEGGGALRGALTDFRRIGTQQRGDYSAFLDPAESILNGILGASSYSGSSSTARPRLSSNRNFKAASPDVSAPKPIDRETRVQNSGRSSGGGRPQTKMSAGAASPTTRIDKLKVQDQPRLRISPKSERVETTSKDIEYQCLYAGFLIPKMRGVKCQPYQELPPELQIELFDKYEFKCKAPQNVMCNPLLFGYVEDCKGSNTRTCKPQKPLCISRSPQATQKCFDEGKAMGTIAAASKIWENSKGENLYNSYINGLKSLCDADVLAKRNLRVHARNDIQKTCAVAFEILNYQVSQKVLPDSIKSKINSNSSAR